MRGLNGKKVWITGAGAGIGWATAQRFQEEGAVLTLIDRVLPPETAQVFPHATLIEADLTDNHAYTHLANHLQNGIDVLINNAGITRDAQLKKMEMADWQAVIDINLTAVFRLSQLVAEPMCAQGSGCILNAASVVAHYGNFGQANYVASKAGVIGMTKTLARELGRFNVRVNAVAPGFIETAMVAKIPEKVLAGLREKPPLKRMGQPHEIAAAYAFLASEDASYISGATLNVDGGLVF
ncbi:MAG: SDR family oxidoreductase [Acidobacteria bacterium]|nr:SDR family oxidoreductase [Acidobacteriota bacterium]